MKNIIDIYILKGKWVINRTTKIIPLTTLEAKIKNKKVTPGA